MCVESFFEVKTLSLKSDASLSELQTKLSQLWSKPLESLSFFHSRRTTTGNGGEVAGAAKLQSH